MKRLLAVTFFWSLVACQPTTEQRVADAMPVALIAGDPTRGLDVADRNCSLCHAIGRDGASPHPKAPPFRTLAARYPLENLSEALAEGIVVGHTGMPQIQLEPQKINDLLSYIKTLPPSATK